MSVATGSTNAAIEVFYWPTSNGHKVTIALEEMGLPYSVQPINILKNEQFETDFAAISPYNKMPVIIDPKGPDGEPITIFESGAILQYLGRKSGKFYPHDERGRIEIDQWLFWQVAALGPMMGQLVHFVDYASERIPYAIERYTKEVERIYETMDRQLADRAYLVGDYSIADMASCGWAKNHRRLNIDIQSYPHVAAWLARVDARPAVIRGRSVGAELWTQGATPGQSFKAVLPDSLSKQ